MWFPFDLAALYAPLGAAGVSVDPALLKYMLTQRDDGTWRAASDGLPPISLGTKDTKVAPAAILADRNSTAISILRWSGS